MKSMRWLKRHPVYAEDLIYTPQHCVNSDMPLKRPYTKIHTGTGGGRHREGEILEDNKVLIDV
jgi:hypothetical protein